jgi:hypothetical protein
MKFPSHFSVPSQKWQGIGENDIGDDQLTPWMVASPQSLVPRQRRPDFIQRNGADMTLRHLKFYT